MRCAVCALTRPGWDSARDTVAAATPQARATSVIVGAFELRLPGSLTSGQEVFLFTTDLAKVVASDCRPAHADAPGAAGPIRRLAL
jgi:hypothetical protein